MPRPLAGALAPVVSLGGATPPLMASTMVAAAIALLIALLTPRRAEPRPTVESVVPALGVLPPAVDRTRP